MWGAEVGWGGFSIASLKAADMHAVEAGDMEGKKAGGRCGHCRSGPSGSCSRSHGKMLSAEQPWEDTIPGELLGYNALHPAQVSS